VYPDQAGRFLREIHAILEDEDPSYRN
jgi:hypothetical protein